MDNSAAFSPGDEPDFPDTTRGSGKPASLSPRMKTDAMAGKPAARRKRGRARIVLIAVVLGIAGYGGMLARDWWTTGRFMVTTDDAYVQADITRASAEVSGRVTRILVADNTRVEKGQPLLMLDSRDPALAVEHARAVLAGAEASAKRLEAQIIAARAGIRQAEAARRSAVAVLTNARQKHARTVKLARKSFAAKTRLDDAASALEQAYAGKDRAEAALASARAELEVLKARRNEMAAVIAQARARLDTAELNLSRTTVTAPVSGVLTGFHQAVGNMITAGQQIGSIVPENGLYIEANYKETQMPGIAPGATVTLEFDAIPDRSFTGRVVSVAAATGALFSVLPPQNATGNFTKIVQRVPVRITIPAEARATGHIRAGLSVTVTVDSRTGNRPTGIGG